MFEDKGDGLSGTVTAVCKAHEDNKLYFKYYDNAKYSVPPTDPLAFEYSMCDVMDPLIPRSDTWACWQPPPSTSADTTMKKKRKRT